MSSTRIHSGRCDHGCGNADTIQLYTHVKGAGKNVTLMSNYIFLDITQLDQAWSQLSFSAKILKKFSFLVKIHRFLCFFKKKNLKKIFFLKTPKKNFLTPFLKFFQNFNFFLKKNFLTCFFEFSTFFVSTSITRFFPTRFMYVCTVQVCMCQNLWILGIPITGSRSS